MRKNVPKSAKTSLFSSYFNNSRAKKWLFTL